MKRLIWMMVGAVALFVLYLMLTTPAGPLVSIRWSCLDGALAALGDILADGVSRCSNERDSDGNGESSGHSGAAKQREHYGLSGANWLGSCLR